MKITETLEQIKENQLNKLFKEKQKLSRVASKTILRRASFEAVVGIANKVTPKTIISEETIREVNIRNIETLLKTLEPALEQAYIVENQLISPSRANSIDSNNSIDLQDLQTQLASLQAKLTIKDNQLKTLEENCSKLETDKLNLLNDIETYRKEKIASFIILNEQKELIAEKDNQLISKDDELDELIKERKAKEEKITKLIKINDELAEEKEQLVTEAETNIEAWEKVIEEFDDFKEAKIITDKILTNKIIELENKNRELQVELVTSQANFESKEQELLTELAKVNQELVDEKDSFDNSEKISQARLKIIRQFQQSIQQLNEENQELEKELAELLEKFDNTQTENDYLHESLDNLRDLLGITEDDLENLTRSLENRTIWNILESTQELTIKADEINKLKNENNNHTCPVIDNQAIERQTLKEIINQLNLTLSEEASVKEVITELKSLIDKQPVEVPKVVKITNTSLVNSLKREISALKDQHHQLISQKQLQSFLLGVPLVMLVLIAILLLLERKKIRKNNK
jgi:hypothetical protein